MKRLRNVLLSVFFACIFMNSFSGNQTDPYRFEIIRKGMETSVSSDDFNFTVGLLKPETVPQSSDPDSWKVVSETSDFKILGGISGQLSSVTYATNIGRLECETWISSGSDLVAFRQIFTNTSKKPVRLNNLFPLFIDGKEKFSFGNISDWLILEQFRHKNDFPVSEAPVAGKSIECDPFLIINNSRGHGKNLFIGYQAFYYHLADISLSFDSKLQLTNITSNCEFEGVVVPLNGSRTSQWAIIAQGDDANVLMSDYTERVRAFYNLPEPQKNAPTVYCTWYYHADNYNEKIFRGDIAQFKKEHLPFEVFLIDECWGLYDWGDFEANNSFPGGMKQVAEQINSAGYTAGIWTAPFLVDHGSNLAKHHPEWLLKNSKGVPCTFNMNSLDHYILDLTYPGVCEYLEEQFRKISQDWGFKYYKFDFMRSMFIDTDQQFYDKSATSLEAYRRGLEAIRRGTGRDAYLSVCGGHYGASLGIADTQRSGSDVKSQWNEKELPKYRQNILRTWMSGLWHVDPDAMMVRRQETPTPEDKRNLTTGVFTDDEAFTNTVNQFIGGNLITFTEDFAIIDEDRKLLYRHVVPSVNSASVPLDIYNTICPEMMLTHISPKCEKLGDWNMLSVVNWTNDPKDYRIILDQKVTGNLIGDRFLVYDFQSREIIASLSKNEILKIEGVKGHQSKVLKIVSWDGESPMFMGTDLNLSCGGIEIADINITNNSISGLLDTGWFVPVKLTFVIPSVNGYEMRQTETSAGQKRFHIGF